MKILWQIGILTGICLAAQWLVTLLPFSFPASVMAMLVLLILLLTGVLKTRHIRELSSWFLQNMALLFVPATVGVLNYLDIIRDNLFPILFISAVTTLLVFAVTGWTVKGLMALQARCGRGTREASRNDT